MTTKVIIYVFTLFISGYSNYPRTNSQFISELKGNWKYQFSTTELGDTVNVLFENISIIQARNEFKNLSTFLPSEIKKFRLNEVAKFYTDLQSNQFRNLILCSYNDQNVVVHASVISASNLSNFDSFKHNLGIPLMLYSSTNKDGVRLKRLKSDTLIIHTDYPYLITHDGDTLRVGSFNRIRHPGKGKLNYLYHLYIRMK
jgi:hypothetical protein